MDALIGWGLLAIGALGGYAWRDLIEIRKAKLNRRVAWPSWLSRPRERK